MSDENISIISGTKEQVALDLAKHIQYNEDKGYHSETEFLALYRKCHKAVCGKTLKSILEED